jgi:hypothetical protein
MMNTAKRHPMFTMLASQTDRTLVSIDHSSGQPGTECPVEAWTVITSIKGQQTPIRSTLLDCFVLAKNEWCRGEGGECSEHGAIP